MVVGSCLPRDTAGRRVAHIGPQRRIGQDPVIGDAPALCVHVSENIGLDQGRQCEVLGGERSRGVVRSEASRILSRCARIEIDADEGARVGIVGTLIACHDVVMRTLEGEDAPRLVRGAQPHNRRVLRARNDDAEPFGPEQRHRIEFDGQSLIGLVNRLPGLCRSDPSGVDATMAGVEEHRLMAVALRRFECLTRSGREGRGIELRLGRRTWRGADAGRAGTTAADRDSGCERRRHHLQPPARFPAARPDCRQGLRTGCGRDDPVGASPQLYLPQAR